MNKFLQQHRQTLQEFAKKKQLKYLALFGSHARGEETTDSDIDLLVEYPPKTSLFDVVRMERELSHKIHKRVDLVSRKFLNEYVKPYVDKDIIPLYEQR
jgi:uncharacterized protein